MNNAHVVVVGAGVAALRAVESLRANGHTGPLTWMGDEHVLPYNRPQLSKSLLPGQGTFPAAPLRTTESYAELDVVPALGLSATSLDTAHQNVHLSDGSTLGYDELVIATGARARTVDTWGDDPRVLTLRNQADQLTLRAALPAAQHVTVLGGGVLGCEIAASVAAGGCRTTLVEVAPSLLLRAIGPDLGAAALQLHGTHGVEVRTATRVTDVTPGPTALTLTLSDSTTLTTDLLVLALGSVPNTDWLTTSGLDLTDGVLCRETGESTVDHVWAVGDVARIPVGGIPRRSEHWTSATDSAQLVAKNLLLPVEERTPLTALPYFWSDQHSAKVQGLGSPSPHDRTQVVSGLVEEQRFLALRTHAGTVTGAVSWNMPVPLMKLRRLLERTTLLDEVLAESPWELSASQ